MDIKQQISQLANQCVMCGLCLPHCPTYQLHKDENESPRGRISLLKAISEGHLLADRKLIQHIDSCIACNACEKMCPSQVQYHTIINSGRNLLNQLNSGNKRHSLVNRILLAKWLYPGIQSFCKIMAPAINILTKISQQFARLAIAEIAVATPLPPESRVRHSCGRVALFTGCASQLFDQQSLHDTIELLNACDLDVFIPEQQQCCGALLQRQGDQPGMDKLARQNLASFTTEADAIIATANTCAAQLKAYRHNQQLETGIRETFAMKVEDVNSFLARQFITSQLQFRPLNEDIALHIPCSLKNVLREEQLLLTLLEQIPGIKLKIINQKFCCGAAGSYMLDYPEVAKQLVGVKITDIINSGCNIVVSSNIGCTLHLKNHLRHTGRKIIVLHPVNLLLRQLIRRD